MQVPNYAEFPADEFLRIGFTQHRTIFKGIKDIGTRCFYIRRCAEQKYTVEELKASIVRFCGDPVVPSFGMPLLHWNGGCDIIAPRNSRAMVVIGGSFLFWSSK